MIPVDLSISFQFQILCIFQRCAFVSRFPGFCRIDRICLHVSTSSFLLLSAFSSVIFIHICLFSQGPVCCHMMFIPGV